MQKLSFTYTGSEALEITMSQFPKSWKNEIAQGVEEIKSWMRIFNCDALAAYQKFSSTVGGPPANSILLLAALHTMNKTYTCGIEIKKLQSEQMQCGLQLIALEQTTTINSHEKQQLRVFYINKQKSNETKIIELIANLDVVDEQLVIHQTNLFVGEA